MGIWHALLGKMRIGRARRIGRREAERLLSAPGADSAYPEVSALLAAAAAPPHPTELTGLEAAVAAYQNAGPAAARSAPRVRRRWVGRSLAVKAMAGTAVLLIGGTAVAAQTGNLPGPAQRHAHDLFSGLGVPPPPSSSPSPSIAPRATPAPMPTPSEHGRTLTPTSPSVPGLCRAWQAQQKNPRGKAMSATAFRDLARVAGGESKIPGFCASVLGGGKSQEPASPAAPTKSPKEKKGGKPAVKPTPGGGQRPSATAKPTPKG